MSSTCYSAGELVELTAQLDGEWGGHRFRNGDRLWVYPDRNIDFENCDGLGEGGPWGWGGFTTEYLNTVGQLAWPDEEV